jgi:thymidylate kinase
VLALDGHDGVGKTTLAPRLAAALGGVAVRPFGGTAGAIQLWAARRGDFGFVDALARQAIAYTLAQQTAPVIVCDRHWMTAFTLLPESYWAAWNPLPPTMLLWIDLPTTLARLGRRGEPPEAVAAHEHYLSRYGELAARFGCPVLRTDGCSEADALDQLVAWARGLGVAP